MKKIIVFLLIAVPLFAQVNGVYDHPYPRKASSLWQGGCTPAYAAKFDLVITWPYPATGWAGGKVETTFAKSVHAINPHTYMFVTRDWNHGSVFWRQPGTGAQAGDTSWATRTTSGTFTHTDGPQYMYDISSYCPKYSGTWNDYAIGTAAGLADGETYSQAIARILTTDRKWSPAIWDGYASDGTWPPYTISTALDLDRDGNTDPSSTVNGLSWQNWVWFTGYNNTLDSLRTKLQRAGYGYSNRMFIWNTLFYGTSVQTQDTLAYWTGNGTEMEFAPAYQGPKTFDTQMKPQMDRWFASGRTPKIILWDYNLYNDGCHGLPGKGYRSNYKQFRWALGICSLWGMYLSMSQAGGSSNTEVPNWTYYYDEYDVPLGHPRATYQAIGSTGCYARFFDRGAVIVNPSNTSQTITLSQVNGLTGYHGPYYRFRGSQDGGVNYGGAFTSVTLTSTTPCASGVWNVGDAIFLFDKDTTIISDIVIDTDTCSTLPGQTPATLTGSWSNVSDSYYPNDYWWAGGSSQNANNEAGYYWTKYVLGSNTTTATASFEPTINVTGDYQVWEWHGSYGSNLMSQYTPIRIYHFGGSDSTTINQSVNFGKWNYVGSYNFQTTSVNKVVLDNHNSQPTRYVMADAFKFVFIPPTYKGDPGKKVFFEKLGFIQPANQWLMKDKMFWDCINKYNTVYYGNYTFHFNHKKKLESIEDL